MKFLTVQNSRRKSLSHLDVYLLHQQNLSYSDWWHAHWGENQLFTQKLPRNWFFKNVKFVKNDTLKMWILWKLSFQKCEFCKNWDFRIVNFVKNETSEMWILWKMRSQKCEFCKNWDFRNVNFVKIEILEMWILWKLRF